MRKANRLIDLFAPHIPESAVTVISRCGLPQPKREKRHSCQSFGGKPDI